jgi:hypothetical protein
LPCPAGLKASLDGGVAVTAISPGMFCLARPICVVSGGQTQKKVPQTKSHRQKIYLAASYF